MHRCVVVNINFYFWDSNLHQIAKVSLMSVAMSDLWKEHKELDV